MLNINYINASLQSIYNIMTVNIPVFNFILIFIKKVMNTILVCHFMVSL